MRRKDDGVLGTEARIDYEQSYGDPDRGGWAPRGRFDDFAERSHYSSQRSRAEDRSGFRRGYQGNGERVEQDRWSVFHAHGDEAGFEAAGEPAFEDEGPDESDAPLPGGGEDWQVEFDSEQASYLVERDVLLGG